jgi:hypothetical protein
MRACGGYIPTVFAGIVIFLSVLAIDTYIYIIFIRVFIITRQLTAINDAIASDALLHGTLIILILFFFFFYYH